jgi:hypothetical protein
LVLRILQNVVYRNLYTSSKYTAWRTSRDGFNRCVHSEHRSWQWYWKERTYQMISVHEKSFLFCIKWSSLFKVRCRMLCELQKFYIQRCLLFGSEHHHYTAILTECFFCSFIVFTIKLLNLLELLLEGVALMRCNGKWSELIDGS